jgi:hypothetical protein
MQRLYKHRAVRVIIGGTWEKSRTLGWYRHDRSGSVPPNVVDSDDCRADAIVLRLAVVSVIASSCFAAALLP